MVELSSYHVNTKTSKFLVIDAQNDVCDSNSAFADSEYSPEKKRDVKPIQEAVEKGILPFLERARKHGLAIGFVQSVYGLGQYAHAGISDKWLIIDNELKDPEWRVKIYREMPKPGEPIFKKDTQETFTDKGEDNGLIDYLKGIRDVLISGFTTDGCVKKAVYALLKIGYNPVVLEDCTATSGYKIKTAFIETLNEFRAHKSIKVVNSKNVVF